MNKFKVLLYSGVALIIVGIIVCFFDFIIGLLLAVIGGCLIFIVYSYGKKLLETQKMQDELENQRFMDSLKTENDLDESEDDL